MALLGAQLLRRERRRLGLTQVQLAERLGTNQSQISEWETGRYPLTVEQLAALLDALGLTLVLEAKPKETAQIKRDDPFTAVLGPGRGTGRKRR